MLSCAARLADSRGARQAAYMEGVTTRGSRLASLMRSWLAVGVVEVGKDVQGALPDNAGGFWVADGVVGVTESGECFGFVMLGSEVSEQVEGVLVAGDGLGVVSAAVVGVAEAVPGVGLPEIVVKFLVHVQGLLALDNGLVVLAEPGVVPADGVEGSGSGASVTRCRSRTWQAWSRASR
jgi:hypothetical protein